MNQILTDEEITLIVRECARGSAINRDGSTSHRIARAIESAVLAKLREQTPVALCNQREDPFDSSQWLITYDKPNRREVKPLYLQPTPYAEGEAMTTELEQKIAEQVDRIKELEGVSECHAIDLRERDRAIKHWSGKCVEQAVVIEKLMDTFEKLACLGNGDRHGNSTGNLIAITALAIPTDSKQILAEWLDKVLGEEFAWVEEGIFLADPFSKKRTNFVSPHSIQTPLFKKPEIK